jgi:hypothetical protein
MLRPAIGICLPNENREIASRSLFRFFAGPFPLFGSAQSSPRFLNDLVAAALRLAYWSIQ